MAGGQDIGMTKTFESKLDTVIDTLATLSQRIAKIEGVVTRLHDGASGIAQSRSHQSQASAPMVQEDRRVRQQKEPWISLPDKFDCTRSKFQTFDRHDKAHWATTKIRSLQQGTRSALAYASDFRQLACNIN